MKIKNLAGRNGSLNTTGEQTHGADLERNVKKALTGDVDQFLTLRFTARISKPIGFRPTLLEACPS